MTISVGNRIGSITFSSGNRPANAPTSYLLTENSEYLLLEDESRLILGYSFNPTSPISSASWGAGNNANGAVWTPSN